MGTKKSGKAAWFSGCMIDVGKEPRKNISETYGGT